MKKLHITNDISLPADFVTQAIAILAKRRAGKSYTMRKIVEQLFETNQQVVIVDPKGDQWGIRSSADGKKPGFPIVILGGEHGDIPLEVGSGELVAKLVVEERVSVLLDLSTFRKYEIATFMAIFLENLYRLKAKEAYRTPLMVVIDEADAIAPQKPQKGEERMLGATDDIVRRGGQRGIGCMLVTQRSAVLNKNVLTQVQMLIVLRTIAPQDLAAMKAWIDVHGDLEQGKELMASLPSLPIGDAWFWSPGWPTAEGIFNRSHVLSIQTFDSGATPKPGEKQIIPKNLADVDLNALQTQMKETIAKAKADDPKELKKRINALEHEIVGHRTEQKRITVQPLNDKEVENLLKIRDKQWKEKVVEIRKYTTALEEIIKDSMGVLQKSFKFTIREGEKNMFDDLPSEVGKKYDRIIVQAPFAYSKPLPKGEIKPTDFLDAFSTASTYPHGDKEIQRIEKSMTGTSGAEKLRSGAMKMLNWLAADPTVVISKQRLATLSGFSVAGGTFNTYISELKRKDWIQGTSDEFSITSEGMKYAVPEEFPSGQELVQMWKNKFREGVGRILQEVYNAQTIGREELAHLLEFEPTGGTFNTYLSELRRNGLIIIEGGIIKISAEFFS